MVNDLWVSKLRKVDVPCVSSCILNDFTGVMNVRKELNPPRSKVDKTSPLLLLSFDFSTLDTKIDLMDLKACMKIQIDKLFHRILKLLNILLCIHHQELMKLAGSHGSSSLLFMVKMMV
jgi:hypothetical protein